MTIVEQIQNCLIQLPPDKQNEVLDFVTFLKIRSASNTEIRKGKKLCDHPAFGSWKNLQIDSLIYEQNLRNEWQL